MILFMQNIAGARNVKPIKRLEALHNDIGAMINGERPTASQDLV
jgi:hypothetical protein